MSESKCPQCQSLNFEMKTATIKNTASNFKFIQCAECGTVVGSFPSFDPQSAHDSLIKGLSVMQSCIDEIGNISDQANKRSIQIQQQLNSRPIR